MLNMFLQCKLWDSRKVIVIFFSIRKIKNKTLKENGFKKSDH
jgi:hypothetical protein